MSETIKRDNLTTTKNFQTSALMSSRLKDDGKVSLSVSVKQRLITRDFNILQDTGLNALEAMEQLSFETPKCLDVVRCLSIKRQLLKFGYTERQLVDNQAIRSEYSAIALEVYQLLYPVAFEASKTKFAELAKTASAGSSNK